jgi:GST-like protein
MGLLGPWSHIVIARIHKLLGGTSQMIELFYYPTPNCHKIAIFLEEAKLPYRVTKTSIVKGEQFAPAFVSEFPNCKIPAIIDHSPVSGRDPLAVFESGAILLYLAEKHGCFLSSAPRARVKTLKWLFWQVSGLGPICGQNHHFQHYAPIVVEYARARFIDETSRLYAVLDGQLADQEFLAGDYSIADIACFPWVNSHDKQSQNLDDFPNVKNWHSSISRRPAVKRAYEVAATIDPAPVVSQDSRQYLYGQNAQTIRDLKGQIAI